MPSNGAAKATTASTDRPDSSTRMFHVCELHSSQLQAAARSKDECGAHFGRPSEDATKLLRKKANADSPSASSSSLGLVSLVQLGAKKPSRLMRHEDLTRTVIYLNA